MTSALIGSVLSQLDDDAKPADNIFVEADKTVDAVPPRPMRDRSEIREPGIETVIDLARWQEDASTDPAILRDFDTEKDRLLLVNVNRAHGDLALRHGRDGIVVLCMGDSCIAAFPALKGDQPIDMLTL